MREGSREQNSMNNLDPKRRLKKPSPMCPDGWAFPTTVTGTDVTRILAGLPQRKVHVKLHKNFL